MRSMFGIRYIVDAKLSRTFRAVVSWLCHFIGLHPMLKYEAPSVHFVNSPKGARYTNDGLIPSDIVVTKIISPERALYTSEAVTPLAIKSKTL